MDAEGIFTVIFILVLLAIPFGLGLHLWRAIRQRKKIENLSSEVKRGSGRVVGYTERRYDPENSGDHYAVVEYLSDQNEVVWAESEGCNKEDHPINAKVDVMYHPRDERRVTLFLTQEIQRLRFTFEKNLGLAFNFIFTIFVLATVFQYHGHAPNILIPLFVSYLAGLLFGAMTKDTRRWEEKARMQDSDERNRRLRVAQQRGDVPCYLKE